MFISLLFATTEHVGRKESMVIDTVVGLGETCLLDGGEVEGVIPKINLVSEKCRPLSDCAHAAWEYGLFSEFP